jgi:hypothetical protein
MNAINQSFVLSYCDDDIVKAKIGKMITVNYLGYLLSLTNNMFSNVDHYAFISCSSLHECKVIYLFDMQNKNWYWSLDGVTFLNVDEYKYSHDSFGILSLTDDNVYIIKMLAKNKPIIEIIDHNDYQVLLNFTDKEYIKEHIESKNISYAFIAKNKRVFSNVNM